MPSELFDLTVWTDSNLIIDTSLYFLYFQSVHPSACTLDIHCKGPFHWMLGNLMDLLNNVVVLFYVHVKNYGQVGTVS